MLHIVLTELGGALMTRYKIASSNVSNMISLIIIGRKLVGEKGFAARHICMNFERLKSLMHQGCGRLGARGRAGAACVSCADLGV